LKTKTVTKRDVKYQAITVCNKIGLKYEQLPENWLRTLYEDHKVEYHYDPPDVKKMKKTVKELIRAGIRGEMDREELKRKIALVRGGQVASKTVLDELRNSEKKRQPGGQYKLTDLTNEPPPAFWVEAYCRNKLLPRTLKVVKMEDEKMLVAYYDYTRSQILPGDYRGGIHESNNFLSIKMD